MDDRDVDDRDVDEAHEDDASYLSVSSTDISESANRSVPLCTIVPHPPRGRAKKPANRISLLTKFFSPKNRLLPLDVIHHQPQAEDDPMQGVHFDQHWQMEDVPEKLHLNFLIKEYRISEEMPKCHASGTESRVDPKTKRVCA